MSNQVLNWNVLFENGSIIDLNISTWLARTKISLADLGIQYSDEVNKVLSLGCHRLAPEKAFENIREAVNAARKSVENHSINFSLIRGARYVPDAKLKQLNAELVEHKARFEQAVTEFLGNYEAMMIEQLPVIQKALQDATKHDTTGEIAMSAFNRLIAEYPTVQEVSLKFGLSWNVYAIQGAKSKEALEMMKSETNTVRDVIGDMVTQLRTELSDRLSQLLKTVDNGGTIQERSIESTMLLLNRVQSLNILGDEKLNEQIANLRNAFSSFDREQEDNQEFKTSLLTVNAELASSIEQAVAMAESNLTNVGKRKLAIV